MGNGLGGLVGEGGTQLKIQTSSWTFRKYHKQNTAGRQHSFEMKHSRLFAFGPHSVGCPLFPKTRQHTLSQGYQVRSPTAGSRQAKQASWLGPSHRLHSVNDQPATGAKRAKAKHLPSGRVLPVKWLSSLGHCRPCWLSVSLPVKQKYELGTFQESWRSGL